MVSLVNLQPLQILIILPQLLRYFCMNSFPFLPPLEQVHITVPGRSAYRTCHWSIVPAQGCVAPKDQQQNQFSSSLGNLCVVPWCGHLNSNCRRPSFFVVVAHQPTRFPEKTTTDDGSNCDARTKVPTRIKRRNEPRWAQCAPIASVIQ